MYLFNNAVFIQQRLSAAQYSVTDKWIEVQIIGKVNQKVNKYSNNRIKLPVEGTETVFSFETGELNIEKINKAVEARFPDLPRMIPRGLSETPMNLSH